MKHTVKEVVLKNGARGLFIDIPGATVMSYRFHFRAGNRQVKSKDIYETAHIMEHMAFGANAKFDSEKEYASEFTKNGAYDNAFTSDNSMVYVGTCADFEWDRILQLQKVAICEPRFNEYKLNSEKGNVTNELSGMLSSHSNLLWPELQKTLGEDILTLSERLDKIKNVKLEDIIEHHARTHVARNMHFIIAGKLHGRKTKLKQMLESWKLNKGKALTVPTDQIVSGNGPILIKQKEAKSLTFGFSFAIDRVLEEAESNALSGLNHILTGTLHSRIFGKARDAGLVYSFFADYDNRHHFSSWDFAGQVTPETAEQLFDLIAAELKDILRGNLLDKEIEATKSYALGRHQMGAQTVSQVIDFYTDRYFADGTIRNYEKVPRDVDKIKKADMVTVAKKFIKEGKFGFVAVGDVDQELVNNLNSKISSIKYDE